MCYRDLRLEGVCLKVAPEFDDSWVRKIWSELVIGGTERIETVELPGNASGRGIVVKVYRRRAAHGWLRRLKRGRAAREGEGLGMCRKYGLPVVSLAFWGEERRWGLLERGVVATERIDAKTVAEVYADRADESLLTGALDVLMEMHRSNLAHGDPRTRNFLATRPYPTVFDLASWGTLGPTSRTQDLVRFLGSASKLTNTAETSRSLLSRYEKGFPRERLARHKILARAAAYAKTKDRP